MGSAVSVTAGSDDIFYNDPAKAAQKQKSGGKPGSEASIHGSQSGAEKKTEWRADVEVHGNLNLLKDDNIPDAEDVTQYAELLAMLRNPVGQKFLGDYAKKILTQESFFCWIDIQEFKSIPRSNYRNAKAKHIYAKYIRPGAVLELGILKPEERKHLEEVLETAKDSRGIVPDDMFRGVSQKCFLLIYHNTFFRCKETGEFEQYRSKMSETYNRVQVDDFDYMEKLGEGAFGRVIHVRKKSTGKHYAMKIQLKKALIANFSDDPTKLDNEKTVFATCNHPYIVGLDYAFCTPKFAILVLFMCTSGTLQDAIDESPLRRLDEDRVRFYTAEIILAMSHLHSLGLMYRDLKPRNVLLGDDGHIMLADMGGVADFAGSVFSKKFRKANSKVASPREEVVDTDAEVRRISIMGTKGYMAPEMVKLMGQSHEHRRGYTKAVDYWSLGVTVYKMLTGRRPFDAHRGHGQSRSKQSEYERLLQSVDFPPFTSEPAQALVRGLLEVNEHQRLGCGPDGLFRLKGLEFFSLLDWDKLEQKHIIPPYTPVPNPPSEQPLFESFDEMMETFDREEQMMMARKKEWQELPSADENTLFTRWNYISPTTLKIEMGIANEMEVLDTNFKVQQMMGTGGGTSGPNGGSHSPRGGGASGNSSGLFGGRRNSKKV